jgi:hypothetical protein
MFLLYHRNNAKCGGTEIFTPVRRARDLIPLDPASRAEEVPLRHEAVGAADLFPAFPAAADGPVPSVGEAVDPVFRKIAQIVAKIIHGCLLPAFSLFFVPFRDSS